MANEKEKTTITDEQIAQAKKEMADELRKEYNLTDEQLEEFFKAAEEANQPIVFENETFEVGAKEPDIRKLSPENFNQMLFRIGVQQLVATRAVNKSLVDILRLLLTLLDKLGVENITKSIDAVLFKLAKQTKDSLGDVLPNKETKN